MRLRFRIASMVLLACATSAYGEVRVQRIAGEPEPSPVAVPKASPVKTAALGSRLLLPYYLVDMINPSGASTLFAVRNETTQPVEIRISYFETDRPQVPQRIDTVTLAAKQIRSTQIRSTPDLLVDDDGFARGYVVIETISGAASIHGDYFQVTPGQAFAAGYRLLNADPQSPHNDLCSVFSVRFLNGGGFTGGTKYTIWLDADQAPGSEEPILYYSVYNEAGELRFTNELYSNEVVTAVDAADLVSVIPTTFGAIEFTLNNTVGHISATMSASGLYTVGLEAVCRD